MLTAIECIRFERKAQPASIELVNKASEVPNELSAEAIGMCARVLVHCSRISPRRSALALLETYRHCPMPTAVELFRMIPHEEDIIDAVSDERRMRPLTCLCLHQCQRLPMIVEMEGSSHWAPPREQIIFHVHDTDK